MLTLWINGRKADIGDETLILFNFTLDDIRNPAVVRNSYTQTVKLPASPSNNAIFKHAFKVGAIFNPLEKLSFVIMDEKSEVLQSGYARMDGWSEDGYNIALYGTLGSFFYSFSTKDDGTPLTLADLVYTDVDGNEHLGPEGQDTEVYLDDSEMTDVLRYEAGSTTRVPYLFRYVNFLGFAPARNGKPDNFDTKKVHISGSGVPDGYELAECATEKTEWEIRDLRTYLQRPVLSVSAALSALETASAGDFTITDEVRALVANLWLTLSMPARPTSDNPHRYSMRSWFDGSMSPTDLMLDIAKTFGLMFRTDAVGAITLMTRAEFYNDTELVDISQRVDYSKGVKMSALAFDAKYYVWDNSVVQGDAAKLYTDTFGKVYGEQVVNTGYDFGEGRKRVLENMKVKSAIMVNKSSIFNFQANVSLMAFSPARYEKVTVRNEAGETMDYVYNPAATAFVYYGGLNHGLDVCELAELGKDGSGVLLYFAGAVALPTLGFNRGWQVTDDSEDDWADTYNGGVPCWSQLGGGNPLSKIPLFSRYDRRILNTIPAVQAKSLDFAESKAIYMPNANVLTNAHYVYADHWRSYISDRYSALTRVMTCRVDLRGMKVGQDLFRRFYWFDNAVWALNKVTNHSLTTIDPTECEFIKVQDINNYR